MPPTSAPELIILGLRLALVAVLYAFLLAVVLLVQRELRVEAAARRSPPPRARLVVLDPGTTGHRAGEPITLEPVTRLGRSAANSVVLDDEFVSASHAIVFLRDGRWWVRDAGSTNGTRVGDQLVEQESPLHLGDRLQIGGVILQLAADE